MTIVIIVLSCLCCYCFIHLFLLKRNIRKLTADFGEARANRDGEQHLQIASPDRDLELLARQLNEQLEILFNERHKHNRTVKSIRDEITNLSHDLRTPITSILGYMSFLEAENLTEIQNESLEVIRRKAYDLNNLVEQLYEYARLENEDYVMKMEQMDICKTLKEHLLHFYPEFEKNRIELELQFPEIEGPVWVNGNRNCVERVLINLTSNAIKYCEGNICVTLKVEDRITEITYRTPKGELTQEDITHLFDRYYRKVKTGSVVQSSGLGLTIAKLYIERMNGEMKARGDEKYLYISFRI